MPSYYEAVGDEPTYELAENIIRATIQKLKKDSSHSIYTDHPERLEYQFVASIPANKHSDISFAMHLTVKHFPDIIKKSNNALYIKDSHKHLLNANDLLIMDYYLLLLNEYEDRVNKYQRYLKKQQYKQQRNNLLLVLFLPFILFVLMILVGD